jgi:hypothetical protein
VMRDMQKKEKHQHWVSGRVMRACQLLYFRATSSRFRSLSLHNKFSFPKWWNVDVMLIKNINFNEFQTGGIFLFSAAFLKACCVYSSLTPSSHSLTLSLSRSHLLYVFIFIGYYIGRSVSKDFGALREIN